MGMTWDEIQAVVNRQREENRAMRILAQPEQEVSYEELEKN